MSPLAVDVLSFSALADFWACPRLYHYRHDLKLPSPGRSTEERRQGSWIHAQLDLHAEGLTPPMASDPEHAPQWQAYLAAIAPYTGLPMHSEWACHLPITVADTALWLHGRMDRIYQQGDSLILLDFKTGTGRSEALTALQLDFYAWLLWQAQDLLAERPLSQIIARAIWLRDPAQPLERRLDAERLPQTESQFRALLSALISSGQRDVPAPRSVDGKPWCTMCEYQRLCPEGIHHAD